MKQFLIFCICILSSVLFLSAADIERWGRYEVSYPVKVKGNPFDVSFSAIFTNSGSKIKITGFYDGDNKFVLRFMPKELGKWSYVTSSNVKQLDGLKGEFNCVSPSADNHGPVIPDGLHFQYSDGKQYYPVGTTSYNWMHVDSAIKEETISSMAKSRFNKLRMLVFTHNFDINYPEPALFPFEIKSKIVNKEGRTEYVWDYERFNPEYFRNVEECVGKLDSIGVEADMILFHPYDDGRWNFDKLPLDVCERYLKYIVSRLSSYKNVWWSLANEYDFLKYYKPEDWDFFTKTVVDNDPYRHMCSIHSYTANYYAYWMDEYTHASIQDHAPVQIGAAGIVKNIYKKPIIFDEVCYEGNMDNRWGNLSSQEYIYRLWNGLSAGTYVTHGECYMDSPDDYSKDFLAIGGEFQGEAWKRIGFALDILEELPNPLNHCDPSWDLRTASAGENYYLIYLGKDVMEEWTFSLPEKNSGYSSIEEGTKFKVEIIDTWNMTVTECGKIFEATKAYNKRVYDKNHGKVLLPSMPYLLLRITSAE